MDRCAVGIWMEHTKGRWGCPACPACRPACTALLAFVAARPPASARTCVGELRTRDTSLPLLPVPQRELATRLHSEVSALRQQLEAGVQLRLFGLCLPSWAGGPCVGVRLLC